MPQVRVSQFSEVAQEFILTDELGDVVDLTGKTLKFIVKRDAEDADDLALFDITATIVDADEGKYRLTFLYAHTSRAPGEFVAALRVWNAAPTTDPPDRVEESTYTVVAGLRAAEV